MLLFVQHNVAKFAFLHKNDFCSPPHDFTKYFIKKGLKFEKIVVEVKILVGKMRIHKVFAQFFFYEITSLT